VGKGCSKKLMFYCNDKNMFMTNLKECWLRTGAGYKKKLYLIYTLKLKVIFIMIYFLPKKSLFFKTTTIFFSWFLFNTEKELKPDGVNDLSLIITMKRWK